MKRGGSVQEAVAKSSDDSLEIDTCVDVVSTARGLRYRAAGRLGEVGEEKACGCDRLSVTHVFLVPRISGDMWQSGS